MREADVNAQTSFGQWLKQRRKMLDLTRDDLAQRVGCAAITLKKIEADDRHPSKQIAELLAEHLNIPPDERSAFVSFARSEIGGNAAPWGTPFHPPHNLLVQATVLIGREDDVAALRRRLLRPETRLLTLIGPPGIGKTRLAQEVAAQVLDDSADGVFFVALAPISDANLVSTTIAITLGVPEHGPRAALERLTVFLREKQLLLLLDNFEQILAAAPQITELLTACPLLKIMATSRAPLRIRHERQLPVSALALPDLANFADAEVVAQYAAVTLFVERGQAVKPDFALTLENAASVAAICIRLDGLPLAIELISARVKMLSPTALLERLSGPLMLQFDGLRDIEPRHRTLNAAIDWSYQLLNMEEQMFFRRLGVFVGGWTLDSAEVVCLDNLSLNILDVMTSLLDKNLVKQDAGSGDEPRFILLETIREYSLEQLITGGELDELRQRHSDYFLRLAEGAAAHAFGHEQLAWFDRVEVEWDNLRAALTWSQESETGLRMAGALGWFFSERGYIEEGLDWLERILPFHPEAPALLRAKALYSAGALAGLHGHKQSQLLLKQALAAALVSNDRWTLAWALSHLGLYLWDDPDPSPLEESITLFRELNDPMGLSHNLVRRAMKAILFGSDYAYARALAEEALNLATQAGDRVISAWGFNLLGRISWLQDHDLEQAKSHLERSMVFFREARFDLGTVLHYLAGVEQTLGNLNRAQLLYEEAMVFEVKTGGIHPVALAGLASLARSRGHFVRAAVLLGTIDEREMPFMARHYPELVSFESDKTFVRDQLGEAAFAAAQAKGQTMTLSQIVAYALSQLD
jgi:predicted ATPase/DNA-binding XRE family transcriptional regulator